MSTGTLAGLITLGLIFAGCLLRLWADSYDKFEDFMFSVLIWVVKCTAIGTLYVLIYIGLWTVGHK